MMRAPYLCERLSHRDLREGQFTVRGNFQLHILSRLIRRQSIAIPRLKHKLLDERGHVFIADDPQSVNRSSWLGCDIGEIDVNALLFGFDSVGAQGHTNRHPGWCATPNVESPIVFGTYNKSPRDKALGEVCVAVSA